MQAEATAPAPPRAASGARLRAFAGRWEALLIGLILLTVVFGQALSSEFLTTDSFTTGSLDFSEVALMALPLTLVIIAAEIDLSVASVLALSSAIAASLWNHGLPVELIIPLCLVAGALCGAFNGVLVTRFGLPSLAVTIGTLALFRGLAFVVLGDGAVADFPFSYTDWVTGTIGSSPVPNVLILIVVLALIFGIVQHATPVGRALYAIGANDKAAHFSGIRVARTKFWLYVVSGAVAGLVGVLWTLRYSSARADNGSGLELAVVAAVLLGGVSIFGGKGSLPGVLAGVVLLAALQNALRLEDVSGQALNIVTGALLVLSVLRPNIATAVRGNWHRRRLRQAAAR